MFIDGGFNDDFVVDMNGQVLAAAKKQNADGAWDVTQIDPSSGGITVLGSSDNVGHALLQGANGTLFVPREITFLYALIDRKLSWSFDPPNAPNTSIFHAATIDCAGRVYVASGTVVYSLISDDPGLADAPWPNYRRDTRATGNFGMARYGVRLPGPDGGVCDP